MREIVSITSHPSNRNLMKMTNDIIDEISLVHSNLEIEYVDNKIMNRKLNLRNFLTTFRDPEINALNLVFYLF